MALAHRPSADAADSEALELLAGAGGMPAIALQCGLILCRLAIGRAKLLAWGWSTKAIFHRALLGICRHKSSPLAIVAAIWSDAIQALEDVENLSTCYFPADARHVSGWSR
jgi:hypothetical protein